MRGRCTGKRHQPNNYGIALIPRDVYLVEARVLRPRRVP